MGNCLYCCLGTQEKNYKSDGTKFYEYPDLVGKDKDYVFKILSNTYSSFRIEQRYEEELQNDEYKPKSIEIYFSRKTSLVTKIFIYK